MKAMRFKYRVQYDMDADQKADNNTALHTFEPTKTIQDAPDSDINELLRRFGYNDGSKLPTSLGPIDLSLYGDFTQTTTLADALNETRKAKDMFRDLPANIKNRFANNPAVMYSWLTDPDNAEEAVKIGLLTKMPEPKKIEPTEVKVINPEALQSETRDESTNPPARRPR